MSFKKNINDIKKNYSLGIIGGGQLALMLTEAAKKRDLEVCVQTKSCNCLLYTSPSPRDRG